MLDYAQEAYSLVQGRSREDLDAHRLLNLSLVHLLEIVGEAANRIPKEDRVRYPQIPWSQIVNMRNRLVHGYDTINLDIVWEIANQDLPPLIAELEKILEKEPRD
ncbi:MAG: hypothetical protein A2V67_15320 [Deltaproteobacteria bacterium RBG_13_61_14]|nr:MAG: hypothetical protein A2V67_15320 [Deltaproteobacteria bacterium RBG_13_61_14]